MLRLQQLLQYLKVTSITLIHEYFNFIGNVGGKLSVENRKKLIKKLIEKLGISETYKINKKQLF